jgi:hypothetical protein
VSACVEEDTSVSAGEARHYYRVRRNLLSKITFVETSIKSKIEFFEKPTRIRLSVQRVCSLSVGKATNSLSVEGAIRLSVEVFVAYAKT